MKRTSNGVLHGDKNGPWVMETQSSAVAWVASIPEGDLAGFWVCYRTKGEASDTAYRTGVPAKACALFLETLRNSAISVGRETTSFLKAWKDQGKSLGKMDSDTALKTFLAAVESKNTSRVCLRSLGETSAAAWF